MVVDAPKIEVEAFGFDADRLSGGHEPLLKVLMLRNESLLHR